jgi:hypothetical protein
LIPRFVRGRERPDVVIAPSAGAPTPVSGDMRARMENSCGKITANAVNSIEGLSMRVRSVEGYLGKLLVLNLLLQLFDGIATYQGLQVGFREANPLLLRAFELLGPGLTLFLFKVKACGLLLLLHQTSPRRVGIPVMRFLAAVYCLFSLGPWLGKFVSLAVQLV